MKVKKVLFSVAMIFGFLIISSSVSKASNDTVSFNVTVTNDYTSSYEVLDLVNKERKNAGLNELKMDKDLLDAAMLRASELVLDFDHTRPNGTICYSVSSKAYGENIAARYSTPEYVMNGWMESTGHRANILYKDFKTIGIGSIKYGSLCYWVQLFGIDNGVDYTVKPNNAKVTRKVEMLSKNVKLYYNSMSEIFKGDYKNGFQTQIVVLNPGWAGRCMVIDPSELIYQSSDQSVFKVNEKGILNFNLAGKTDLTVKLKQNPNISVKQKISVVGRAFELKINEIEDQVYTNSEIKPNICIKDGNYTLVQDKDYKLEYLNNKNCGEAKIKVTCIGNYIGNLEKTFKITPAKVTKLKVNSRSDNSLNVSWKKLNGITGYKVYLYNYSKGKYEYYGKTNKPSIAIKKLKAGTTYKIRVRAYKSVNGMQYFGEYASSIKAVTNPSKVTKLKINSMTKNSIKLSWKKQKNVTGYKIYLYNNKTNKYEYYGKTGSTSIKIKKLKRNTKYKIKVRAYKTFNGKQYLGKYSSAIYCKIK